MVVSAVERRSLDSHVTCLSDYIVQPDDFDPMLQNDCSVVVVDHWSLEIVLGPLSCYRHRIVIVEERLDVVVEIVAVEIEVEFEKSLYSMPSNPRIGM